MIKSLKMLLVRILIKFIPETSLFGLKRVLYRFCGYKIGENVQICSSAKLLCRGELVLGKNVWIGHEAVISCNEGSSVIIEDYARVGMRVIIVTGFHAITPEGDCIQGEGTVSNILICKGAAISTMSIILPGKTVHRMAHVAAGAIVTKDVPEYSRVAGSPARVIKEDLRK